MDRYFSAQADKEYTYNENDLLIISCKGHYQDK